MNSGGEMNLTEQFARKVLEVVDAGLVSGLGEPVPGKMCVEAAVNYAMGRPHGDEPDCVSPALRNLKITLNDSRWSTNKARTAGLRRLAIAQLGSAGVLDEKEFARRCAMLAIQFALPFALRAAASTKANGAFKEKLLEAAEKCEREPTRENALKAKAASASDVYAASAAAAAASVASVASVASHTAAAAASVASVASVASHTAAASAAYAYAAAASAHAAAASASAAAAAADSFLADFCERIVQILIDMKAPGCGYLYLTEIST
jgi:hypothetical protein